MPTIELHEVRALCLGLPEVEERRSHGSPAFFAGAKGRSFAMHRVDHHGDGRIAVWIAAPDGAQDALVGGDPDRFFVPPYVGHRGWIGVHLGRGITTEELGELLTDAYVTVATTRLARLVDAPGA